MINDKIRVFIAKLQLGFGAHSSLLICIISGVILSFVYDVNEPVDSLSIIILLNKPALFIRSVHYWSAQFFLIFSFFHAIEHLLKKSEVNIKLSSWLGITLLIPIILFSMLSGFFLKGDYESIQALSIFKNLINQIPLAGNFLSNILIGGEKNYQVIYINHIFTATILIWLLTIEHSKKLVTTAKNFLFLLPVILLFSGLLIPNIEFETTVSKGPWYFLGVQEALHWLSHPYFILISFLLYLISFYLISSRNTKFSSILKISIFVSTIFYSCLIILGLFFRGDSWKFILPWVDSPKSFNYLSLKQLSFPDTLITITNLPKVDGRIESCLICHSDMSGLSQSHNIMTTGCYSCHLGNRLSLNKNYAHEGMTLTPGNLDIVKKTCGNSKCHYAIAERVNNSLMSSMSGIIAVNKFVFDETNTPDGHYNIKSIGYKGSDGHLRALCASCHLSNNKENPEPVNELSRGGGCSACHLNYGDSSLLYLNKRLTKNSLNPKFHPEISINVKNNSCFGCHSRSGRISTNFEGWHETHLKPNDLSLANNSNFRLLEDGRVFEKMPADVHFNLGMLCIDCHNSYEVMGDGKKHLHKENAVQIHCSDCHTTNPKIVNFSNMDYESQKILSLKNKTDNKIQYISAAKSGIPFINTYFDNNNIITERKNDSKKLISKPPNVFCGNDIAWHSRLDCITCHTSWSPQCIGCHTGYDKKLVGYDNLLKKEKVGGWFEIDGDFHSEFPTLGIVKDNNNEKVKTFVPGMVLRINTGEKTIFKRLFAPLFSHTITKNSLDCKKCHNNPLAIGYGRGVLKYSTAKGKGKWEFIAKYNLNKFDNLNEDAWTGFLKNPSYPYSTRKNARPFNIEEQKKILTVGACFVCHSDKDKKILKKLKDVNYLKSLPTKCILPEWN